MTDQSTLTDDHAGQRVIQSTSIEAAELRKAFCRLEPGQDITDDEVSKIIGGDWRNKAWVVATARRQAIDSEVVMARIRNMGWMRLNPDDTSSLSEHALASIRRSSRRQLKIQATVKPESLSPQLRPRHFVNASLLGLVSFSTQARQRSTIEARVTKADAALAISDTMAALLST